MEQKKDVPMAMAGLIISSARSGLLGFVLFFAVELLSKTLAAFVDRGAIFSVDIWDVYLSSIGFVLLFLISFLSGMSKRTDSESDKVNIQPLGEKERESQVFINKRKAV